MMLFLRDCCGWKSGSIIRARRAQKIARRVSRQQTRLAANLTRHEEGSARRCQWQRAPPGRRAALVRCCLSILWFHDLQVVGDRESARDAVGSKTGEIFVTVAVHDAFQGHMAILDNDADG